jgi:hypothetical protein
LSELVEEQGSSTGRVYDAAGAETAVVAYY